MRKWSESLKKTSPDSFYNISKDAVLYSNSGDLMRFYKSFFNKRIYLYGAKSNFFFQNFYLVQLDIRYMIVVILVFTKTLMNLEKSSISQLMKGILND